MNEIYVTSARQLRDASTLGELYDLWQAAKAQYARTHSQADFELAAEAQFLHRHRTLLEEGGVYS